MDKLYLLKMLFGKLTCKFGPISFLIHTIVEVPDFDVTNV